MNRRAVHAVIISCLLAMCACNPASSEEEDVFTRDTALTTGQLGAQPLRVVLAAHGASFVADALLATTASGEQVVVAQGPIQVQQGDVIVLDTSTLPADFVSLTLTQIDATGQGDQGVITRPLHDREVPVSFTVTQECGTATVEVDLAFAFVPGRGHGNARGLDQGKGQGRGKSQGKGFDRFTLDATASVSLDETGCDPCDGPVSFADPALEADVRARLGIASGDLIGRELERLDSLGVSGLGVTSLAGLECAINLQSVFANDNAISDLSPLQDATGLEVLEVARNPIASIEPLRDKPLRTLNVSGSPRFSDLSPLANTATLEALFVSAQPGVSPAITDISALANKPALSRLQLVDQTIADLSPLADATSLSSLNLANNPVGSLEPLRGKPLTSLIISGRPQLTDLSPLSGVTTLRTLVASTSRGATVTISELGPLSGLQTLERLELRNHDVSDLSVLSGLTGLQNIALSNNPVTDTSPLAGRCDLSVVFLDTRALSCPDATLDALEACGVTVVSLCP